MSDSLGWQDDFDPGLIPADARGIGSCVLTARLDSLPDLIKFTAAQARLAGLDAADSARLAIVIEELFVNTVTHGYADTVGATPLVKLTAWIARDGAIRIDYRDRGRPFDPLRDGPSIAVPAGEILDYLSRRIGGVGLWLLRHYVQQAEYVHLAGCNRLCFSLGGGARLDEDVTMNL